MLSRREFMKSGITGLVALLIPKPVANFIGKYIPKKQPLKFTGNMWFIDPANGNDNNDGKSPNSAFATKAAAIRAVYSTQEKNGTVLTFFGNDQGEEIV